MNTQAIDKLINDTLSLIQTGKKEDPAAAGSVATKTEALLLAKAIKSDVKAAAAEVAQLTDDQRDELSLRLGYEFLRIVGGA